MRIRCAIALLVALAAASGCQESVQGPPAGRLGGFVYREDGSPALGLRVSVAYDVPYGTMDAELTAAELDEFIGLTDGELPGGGNLLLVNEPWPTRDPWFLAAVTPEAGVLTASLHTMAGDRIFHHVRETEGPDLVVVARSPLSEAWRNGYHVLKLRFDGDTVHRSETVHGLLLNADTNPDLRPLASTNEVGRFDIPLADLALGARVWITGAPEDGGLAARRVPDRVRLLVSDGERLISHPVDLPDLDRAYEIELTFPDDS